VKASNNVFFNISGEFTLDHGTVGVGSASLTEDISVSPIPASDVVRISIPAAIGEMRARVVNTLGQSVWSGTLAGAASLQVAGWAHGVYYLHMSGEGGLRMSRKIVVE
jgi:hypothetical protein